MFTQEEVEMRRPWDQALIVEGVQEAVVVVFNILSVTLCARGDI